MEQLTAYATGVGVLVDFVLLMALLFTVSALFRLRKRHNELQTLYSREVPGVLNRTKSATNMILAFANYFDLRIDYIAPTSTSTPEGWKITEPCSKCQHDPANPPTEFVSSYTGYPTYTPMVTCKCKCHTSATTSPKKRRLSKKVRKS